MFTKREDATEKSRVTLRSKESKQLRAALPLCLTLGGEGGGASLVDLLLPPKGVLEQVKFAGAKHIGYAVEHQRASFIDLDPKAPSPYRLLPTLALLWRLPAACAPILPTLLIPPAVSTYLIRGADLMLAGVLTPAAGLPTFEKGTLVAVRVAGNPAALAVGEALVSAAEAATSGMRGKGVRLIHFYGDALWDAGGRVCPNRGFVGDRVETIGLEEPELRARVAEGQPEGGEGGGGGGDAAGGVRADGGAGDLGEAAGKREASQPHPSPSHSTATAEEEEGVGGARREPWWASATPDALFTGVFLQCLAKKRHLPAHLLPILPSALLGSVMPSARPKGRELQVKRTSWKKFGAFLTAMVQEGLAVVDEEGRLASWDVGHPLLVGHRAWPASAEVGAQVQAEAASGAGEAFAAAGAPGGGGGGSEQAVGGRGGGAPSLALAGCSSPAAPIAVPTCKTFLVASRWQLGVMKVVLLARLMEWCSRAQQQQPLGGEVCSAGSGGGGGVSARSAPQLGGDPLTLSLPGMLLVRSKRHRGGPATARSLGTRLVALSDAVLPAVRRAFSGLCRSFILAQGGAAGQEETHGEEEEEDREEGEAGEEEEEAGDDNADNENEDEEEEEEEEEEFEATAEASASSNATGATGEPQFPLTPEAFAKLFLACLPDLSSQSTVLLLTPKEVTALCTEYISLRGLGDPVTRKNALLDVTLAQGIAPKKVGSSGLHSPLPPTFPPGGEGGSGAGSGASLLPPEAHLKVSLRAPSGALAQSPSLPREDILAQWHTRFTPWWAFLFPREVIVRAGTPPQLLVGRKALQGGRRSITYVAGLEAFRLDPKALAHELARLLAAAATLQPAAPLGCVMEGLGGESIAVVVQGDEVEKVREFLCGALKFPSSLVRTKD